MGYSLLTGVGYSLLSSQVGLHDGCSVQRGGPAGDPVDQDHADSRPSYKQNNNIVTIGSSSRGDFH